MSPHSRVSQGGREGTGSQPGEADLVMSPSQQGQSGRREGTGSQPGEADLVMSPSQQGQSGREGGHRITAGGGRPRHVSLTACSVREGGRAQDHSRGRLTSSCPPHSRVSQGGGRAQDHSQGGRPRHVPLTAGSVREGGRAQDHSRGRLTSSCPPHSRVSQGGREGTGSQPGEADLVMSPSQQGQSGREGGHRITAGGGRPRHVSLTACSVREGGRAQDHSRGRLTSSCPPHSRVSQGGREGTGSQPGEADLVMSPSQQGQSGRREGTGSQPGEADLVMSPSQQGQSGREGGHRITAGGGRPRHVSLTACSVREGGRAQDHSRGRLTSSCPPHSRVSQGGGRAQDHSQGGRPRHVPLTAGSVREGGRAQDHSRGRLTSSCLPHSRVSQGGREGGHSITAGGG